MSSSARVVNVWGKTFKIVADGDWGGGDIEAAIDEVIDTLRKMTKQQREHLHHRLMEEQSVDRPHLREEWGDEIVTLGSLAHFANAPTDDLSYAATLHVYALTDG